MVLLHYEHISIVCLSEHKATKKYRKNLPKTLPKRGPNPSKIDAENVLFFNIDFFRFRARFWSLLGRQVGAKLAFLVKKKTFPGRSGSRLKLEVFQKWCLGGLQPRFWRPRNSILEALGWILEAPELDFRGSRPRFWSLQPRF